MILVGEAHVDSPSLPNAERARLSSLLAQAFRRKGEFERALEHAQRAVRALADARGPGVPAPAERAGPHRAGGGPARGGAGGVPGGGGVARGRRDQPDRRRLGPLHGGRAGRRRPALVERALALDPAYGNAYHLRGWILLARGRYRRGRRQPAAGVRAHAARVRQPAPGPGRRRPGRALLRGRGAPAQRRVGEGRAGAGTADRVLPPPAGAAGRGHRRRRLAGRQLPRPRGWPASGKSAQEPPRLQGDDTTYFVQTARLHAVQGRRQEALRELAQGLALGHGELQHVRDDPDFASLRGDPEWRRLTAGPLSR